MMGFKIGSTLVGLATLDSILTNGTIGGVTDPDWSFQPYSRSITLGNGQIKGQGYPVARWRWNELDDASRATLKAFVGSNLSATVYIETATYVSSGAPVFAQYQAIMQWPPEDEDFQANKVLGLVIVFTHLVVQP